MKVGKLTQKGVELGAGGSSVNTFNVINEMETLFGIDSQASSSQIIEAFGSEDAIYNKIDYILATTDIPIIQDDGGTIYPAVFASRNNAEDPYSKDSVGLSYMTGTNMATANISKDTETGEWVYSKLIVNLDKPEPVVTLPATVALLLLKDDVTSSEIMNYFGGEYRFLSILEAAKGSSTAIFALESIRDDIGSTPISFSCTTDLTSQISTVTFTGQIDNPSLSAYDKFSIDVTYDPSTKQASYTRITQNISPADIVYIPYTIFDPNITHASIVAAFGGAISSVDRVIEALAEKNAVAKIQTADHAAAFSPLQWNAVTDKASFVFLDPITKNTFLSYSLIKDAAAEYKVEQTPVNSIVTPIPDAIVGATTEADIVSAFGTLEAFENTVKLIASSSTVPVIVSVEGDSKCIPESCEAKVDVDGNAESLRFSIAKPIIGDLTKYNILVSIFKKDIQNPETGVIERKWTAETYGDILDFGKLSTTTGINSVTIPSELLNLQNGSSSDEIQNILGSDTALPELITALQNPNALPVLRIPEQSTIYYPTVVASSDEATGELRLSFSYKYLYTETIIDLVRDRSGGSWSGNKTVLDYTPTHQAALTPDEKLQARANIGAVSIDDVKSVGLNQLMNSDFEIGEYSKNILDKYRADETSNTSTPLISRDPIALHYHIGNIPDGVEALPSTIPYLASIDETYTKAAIYTHKGVRQKVTDPTKPTTLDTRIDYSIRIKAQPKFSFSFDYAVYPDIPENRPDITINTYTYLTGGNPASPALPLQETFSTEDGTLTVEHETIDSSIGLYRYYCTATRTKAAGAIQLIVGKKIPNISSIAYYTGRWKLEDSDKCTSYSKLPYIDDSLRAARYATSLSIEPSIQVADGTNIFIPWKFFAIPYVPERVYSYIDLAYHIDNLYIHVLNGSNDVYAIPREALTKIAHSRQRPTGLILPVGSIPLNPGDLYMINADETSLEPAGSVLYYNCNVHLEVPYPL